MIREQVSGSIHLERDKRFTEERWNHIRTPFEVGGGDGNNSDVQFPALYIPHFVNSHFEEDVARYRGVPQSPFLDVDMMSI